MAGEVGGPSMQRYGEPGREETKASSKSFQKASKDRQGSGAERGCPINIRSAK